MRNSSAKRQLETAGLTFDAFVAWVGGRREPYSYVCRGETHYYSWVVKEFIRLKPKSFNVRLVKIGGRFVFDDVCFMHRSAKRGENREWLPASKADRKKLAAQLR